MARIGKTEVFYLLTLLILAVFIWMRDLSWSIESDNTLPILVSIPIFIWLGWPWKWAEGKEWKPEEVSKTILFGAFLFLLGTALDLTILLTMGWVLLLYAWLVEKSDPQEIPKIRKLMVFPLLAFPWIAMDMNALGWLFRYSAAYITGFLFTLFGADVIHEGTNVNINGLPISVEAACSGLNTLQSMLIAGSVVAYIFFENSSRYWWAFPQLFLCAWIANTLRVIVISITAIAFGVPFAMGAFHYVGGWMVIMIMFIFCWLLFSIEAPSQENNKGEQK
jgi:exosortase